MSYHYNNKLSKYACIIGIFIMAFTSFVYYPRWNKVGSEAMLTWDVSGYYWYLPSVFIYNDLKHQGFKDSLLAKYQTPNDFQQGVLQPNGNYVLKYSSGMALMYLPFFTAGHIAAKICGYPQDGFSTPYQLALQLGGFLISIVGIWYLRKLMLRFYEDKVVAILLLVLILGTNYLNSGVIDDCMSHNWLFTIYVFLLLNTIHFYDTFKTKYAIRIGLLIGIATLTRPTEVISCLIPLLWGMENISFRQIKERALLLIHNFRLFLLAVACATAIISIQFIYWKYASGHWIVYSYQDQHLYFRSPNIINYTFSYRTGWLRYCPTMLFSFVGLIPFFIKGKNKVAVTTFFLVNYYIVCAWSIWWFGGRAMIQSYPVLMFPMASLIAFILNRKWLIATAIPILLACIYLNIWYTHQCHYGGLYHTDNMTKDYYNRVIGRWSVPPGTIALLDQTELYEGTPRNVQTIWQNDFELDSLQTSKLSPITGKKSLELNGTTKEVIEFKFPYKSDNAQWLRFSADFKCGNREFYVWKMAQIVGRLYKNGVKQKENMFRIYRFLNDNETKNLSLDMNITNQQFDSVSIGFWNGYSELPLIIDNIKVVSFDEQ